MFFKRFTCLSLFVSILLSSFQVYASDLSSGGYIYLPNNVSASAIVIYAPFYPQQGKAPDRFKSSNTAVDMELDRIESMRKVSFSQVIPEKKISSNKIVQNTLVQNKISPAAVVSEAKIIALDDIINSNPEHPKVRLEYKTFIIIQGKNIQRFLAMDEGFINVLKIDHNQIKVEALRYGGTFLNIWDDKGRRTIYVGVIFPQVKGPLAKGGSTQSKEHEKPFRFSYTGDWNTYYYGPKGQDFKRQSYDFVQNYALEGQSPYGYFDSSLIADNFNGHSNISSYTVGLSQIPMEGTNNLNLRVFDANRALSALSMPSTRLHGVFADVEVYKELLGFSYSYGQKKPYFYFLSQGGSLNSYINAFKLTLFPSDLNNQVSLNLAEGSGSQHEDYLAKRVYSIDAHKKIYDTYLNAELAEGNDRRAALAGLKWQKGTLSSALNFRQINKQFTTVSGFPSNQGETGAIWTTNVDGERFTEETIVNLYRQYLYVNPDNPQALNYDISGHVRVSLLKGFLSDTNMYYIHTPGEISPRRNINLSERISKIVNLLGFKNTSLYTGVALQRTRYELSDSSEYDRYTSSTGIQVPLTNRLSVYSNYDYSWVHEIASENDINPSVFNTGFYYNRQFTDKFSGNLDASYRKEMGAKGTSSYLAGEDSAGISLGFSYNPSSDVNFYVDGRTRHVWPQIAGNVPYNDLNIRLGVRMSFDVFSRGWDPHGRISGYVYRDKLGSGYYQAGDQGIAGVKVKAGNYQAITDKNGFYQMDITAKNVSVAPDTGTIPAGVVFSTPTSKLVDIKQWGHSQVDFGLNAQTGVYGLVFVDKNSNGIPDAADQFIRNAKIILDKKHTSISDAQGAFYFRNVSEGEHTVTIDINSLPINMIPQIKLVNKIKVAEGTTYLLHIPLKAKDEQ